MIAVEAVPRRAFSSLRARRQTHQEGSYGKEARPDPGAAGALLTTEQRSTINVLIVDDEESLLEGTAAILSDEQYAVTAVPCASEADARLSRRRYDIVLLDLHMSGVQGRHLLRKALETDADTAVIVMTGRPTVESSVEALRAGAWDYLPKPFTASQLRILVGRAAHTVHVSRKSKDPQTPVEASTDAAQLLMGASAAFKSVLALARKVASTDVSVFITGESGTGKELVAQFIHSMSRRSGHDLVAVNCAALPDALLESEMFGHVKGAFTGATRDKTGLMETADGGTLFLDEVAEMSAMTQAKLLRVLQDGVLRKVGASQTSAIVDLRLISATNRDPASAVADGLLREDLYYRLGVVQMYMPALRERPDDIPLLAKHFLGAYWRRHHGGRRAPPEFTPAALEDLQSRPWKGNVRELQNVIEHAIVVAESRNRIDVADLPPLSLSPRGRFLLGAGLLGPGELLLGYRHTRDQVIARFEREYLARVLQETGGNVSDAAQLGRMNSATLYRMLKRHGLAKCDVLGE